VEEQIAGGSTPNREREVVSQGEERERGGVSAAGHAARPGRGLRPDLAVLRLGRGGTEREREGGKQREREREGVFAAHAARSGRVSGGNPPSLRPLPPAPPTTALHQFCRAHTSILRQIHRHRNETHSCSRRSPCVSPCSPLSPLSLSVPSPLRLRTARSGRNPWPGLAVWPAAENAPTPSLSVPPCVSLCSVCSHWLCSGQRLNQAVCRQPRWLRGTAFGGGRWIWWVRLNGRKDLVCSTPSYLMHFTELSNPYWWL
jgi:hypothetical protein